MITEETNNILIEESFYATLRRMDSPEYIEYVADQLNAIQGFFLKDKGWLTSTSRDREYFESGWTSGYARCLFDVASGKVDVSTEIKIQNEEVEETQK